MGVKYKIEFANRTDEEFEIYIDIPSYDGLTIDLKGVSKSVLSIDWKGDENPMLSRIIGSQAKINVYNQDNIDLEELSLAPDLEYSVTIYKDLNLFWKGFLIADGIQEGGLKNSQIQLTAVDGLNALKGLDVRISNPPEIAMPDSYESDRRCPMNWIRQCINTMGNVLPINWMCKIENEKYESIDVLAGVIPFAPDGQFFLLNKVDAYDTLRGILDSFRLSMCQRNGEWYIVNMEDLCANDWIFEGYRIPFTEINIKAVATEVTEDWTTVRESVNNRKVTMYNKPISKAKVTYNAMRDENILPNGSMNLVTSGGQNVYWGNNVDDVSSTLAWEGINGRIRDKFGLLESSIWYLSEEENAITCVGIKSGLPFDAKKLFPRLTLGLTVAPINYPVYTSGDRVGQINWMDNPPLSLKIEYQIMRDDIIERWYLNENGYWVKSGEEQLVIDWADVGLVYVGGGMRVGQVKAKFSGKMQGGQYIRFGVEGFFETTRVFPNTILTYEDSIQAIVDAFPESGAGADPYIFAWYDSFEDVVYFKGREEEIANVLFGIYLSDVGGAISTKINLIAENAMNGDVIKFQFTSKGGESRIRIPEPDFLSNESGILTYYIYHNGAYQSYIDDVYVNVDDNNDVFTAYIPMLKDSLEEHELIISSGFSGFLHSSYMMDFSTCNQTMNYTHFGVSATLTEHYARSIIRLKGHPYKKVDDDLLGFVFPFNSMLGLCSTASCVYNAHEDITSVTMIEYKLNDIQPVIEWKGSNDDKIS